MIVEKVKIYEAKSIMHSLMETNCKVEHLIISMELEDKSNNIIKTLKS